MNHPFDGVSRRKALGAMAAAAAGLLGLKSVANAQKIEIGVTSNALGEEGGGVATTLALGEEGAMTKALGEAGGVDAKPATTEPFGEEAGSVTSQAVPGLETGVKGAVTKAKGEDAGPATDAVNEGGGPATGALNEGGIVTKALREGGVGAGAAIVTVAPDTTELTDKQMQGVWTEMGDKDAMKGVQGCAMLYGAKKAVSFLKDNLKAKEEKEGPVDAKTVAALIAKLDSEDFEEREKAEADLAKIGEPVATALQKALRETKSAEQRMRLQRLVEKVKEPADRIQARRGLEVLIALGTPEAKELVETLSKGSDKAWLTGEAKSALDRFVKK
jgi:hypothetical protein